MSTKRKQIRAMNRERSKRGKEARFLFLSMQAKCLRKRFALAWRLLWRLDLRRRAKQDGVTLRQMKKSGVVERGF